MVSLRKFAFDAGGAFTSFLEQRDQIGAQVQRSPVPGKRRYVLPPLFRRLGHQEAMTGFRSGDPDTARDGEPQPAYDSASTSLSARVRAKADELGLGVAAIWRKLGRWRDQGLWALVDQRSVQMTNPLAGVDSRLIDAIITQHAAAEVDDSTGTPWRQPSRSPMAGVSEIADNLPAPGKMIRFITDSSQALASWRPSRRFSSDTTNVGESSMQVPWRRRPPQRCRQLCAAAGLGTRSTDDDTDLASCREIAYRAAKRDSAALEAVLAVAEGMLHDVSSQTIWSGARSPDLDRPD